MKRDLFTQRYATILISVRFLGLYWEFWSEYVVIGDDRETFFNAVRDKYRKKFKGRKFIMRLYYPNEEFVVDNKTVTHML